MITTLFCFAYPALVLYAAWHDVSTMTIPNWVSILLAVMFVPAALSAGLTVEEIGLHLAAGAVTLLICAGLFYLSVFGGGDAKVIAAVSLWTGFSAAAPFVMGMALAGGALAGSLLLLRRMKVHATAGWSKRLLSPEEGAPYAVAIAAGALAAAPYSPVLAAGLRGIGI
jgi:prepilin peptidase CpaA